MIVLDTHIWVWWTQDITKLSPLQIKTIEANETDIIGLSAISCWEIAKLVEYGKLNLSVPIEAWFSQALDYPGFSYSI